MPLAEEDEFLLRLAAVEWGGEYAEMIVDAWKLFFSAYELYPFSRPFFYYGPIARSPAYHLYLDKQETDAAPYNWGIERNRTVQPYADNLQKWLGDFSADEIVRGFRAMGEEWERGLAIMRNVAAAGKNICREQRKELAVAEALCLQFFSTANVVEFYALRDSLYDADEEQAVDIYLRMKKAAEDDVRLALQMKKFIQIDSSIGFQSEMHYFSFSEKLIDEKVAQVKRMLEKLTVRICNINKEA
jgi:hypothetical protein